MSDLIPKPETAAEVLDIIDQFLVEAGTNEKNTNILDTEAGKLWDVLSALRGPDNNNHEDKAKGAAVVRALAFPKLVAKSLVLGSSHFTPLGYEVNIDAKEPSVSTTAQTHYYAHIASARTALRKMGRIR